MVPERAGKVETNGDQAGEQDVRQMFARCVLRIGIVSRPDGLDPVAATTQPALQRDGRAPQPQLYGLPLAINARCKSVIDFNYKCFPIST